MRQHIPDELFKELEQIEGEKLFQTKKQESKLVSTLKYKLECANNQIAKMRLDYIKEVQGLRNMLALSYNQPRKMVKLHEEPKKNEMEGEKANVLQEMIHARPTSPSYISAIFFDQLEVANNDVRMLLNFKI